MSKQVTAEVTAGTIQINPALLKRINIDELRAKWEAALRGYIGEPVKIIEEDASSDRPKQVRCRGCGQDMWVNETCHYCAVDPPHAVSDHSVLPS